MEFLIHTGAAISVLNQALYPISGQTTDVVGATAQSETAHFLKPLTYKIGKSMGIHQFLYLLDAPRLLVGGDLLEQLNAEIKFDGNIEFRVPKEKHVKILSLALTVPEVPKEEIMEEIINQIIPWVWASVIPGKAKNAEISIIQPKEGTAPVRVKQYPLELEDRKVIKSIIKNLINYGLLIEYSSEYNTPILPIKKLDGKTSKLVQDLRTISQVVEDLHPVVANPCTLLTNLRENLE